jgi:hypothetical protein
MSQHTELLARYKHLRQAGKELNHRLVATLSKSEIHEGAKDLGLLKKGVLVFDNEAEMPVLMDYCLHDVRRQGRNAFDRYLAETPPPPGSEELEILRARQQAYFSLFAVESVELGVGLHVRDLLRDEPLFLVDVGFSSCAVPGLVLASRIHAPEGIVQTTGAAFPLGVLSPAERASFVQALMSDFKGMDVRSLTREQSKEFFTPFIRECLNRGVTEKVKYADPSGGSGGVRAPAAPPLRKRVGRNGRCPSGSGKKFKLCCGSRV